MGEGGGIKFVETLNHAHVRSPGGFGIGEVFFGQRWNGGKIEVSAQKFIGKCKFCALSEVFIYPHFPGHIGPAAGRCDGTVVGKAHIAHATYAALFHGANRIDGTYEIGLNARIAVKLICSLFLKALDIEWYDGIEFAGGGDVIGFAISDIDFSPAIPRPLFAKVISRMPYPAVVFGPAQCAPRGLKGIFLQPEACEKTLALRLVV